MLKGLTLDKNQERALRRSRRYSRRSGRVRYFRKNSTSMLVA